MSKINKNPYDFFLLEIKKKIHLARIETLRHVNKTLLKLYWDLGQMIVDKQNKYGWGKSIVASLSEDLQNEFPGAKGFSMQNLWYMRQLYLEYKDNLKLQPLVGEISWSHNLLIMSKCKDLLSREFYIQMTIKCDWTKNELIRQIEAKTFEKYLLNQTNFEKSVSKKYKQEASLAVKDEYNFDFLGLKKNHSEKELELLLMKNIEKFLSEMGGDFTFIGNQYRLRVEEEDFFIDLLLFHRRLKSLVAIELKTGKFKPEFAGKMNFYLAVLDDTKKLPDENPSIGIIICKSKSKTMVEYALKNTNSPIGIGKYTISETLPNEYIALLPSPNEIEVKLAGFFDKI